jgi:3-polyprenyl-4-hydroxybenzoate decarboxylase
MPRITVGVSGASGSIYAIQTLRASRAIGGHEVHLVISTRARQTIKLETDVESSQLESLASLATLLPLPSITCR